MCARFHFVCFNLHALDFVFSQTIDGAPSDFIPGITDHYGKMHNFDALVGVLLSDVPKPMSGELCTYPGK